MEKIIPSFGTHLYTHGKHHGYLMPFMHIAPFVRKWSRNRDPDMTRVRDMLAYHEKGGYIPKLIHLAEASEGLVCYDGNHRRELLTLLPGETSCIVDVMFDATPDDIFESFEHINKAVDVPDIFLNDMNDIKDDVLQLVKQYETKYPSFVSKSSKCRSPNFNRDTLTDNITTIYSYLNGTKTVKEIGELLETLNHEYSNNKICKKHSTYRDTIIEKCKTHGLWLFLERQIPNEHVERLAQRKRFGIF